MKGRVYFTGLCDTLCISEYSPPNELLFSNNEVPFFFNEIDFAFLVKASRSGRKAGDFEFPWLD